MSTQRNANPSGSVVMAHEIRFVRADGSELGRLVVDDQHQDLVLRSEDGKPRLSVSGLGGINIPPLTACCTMLKGLEG